MFGQFSLAGNRVEALHLAFFWLEIILVTCNGIESRKVEEKRKSMRKSGYKI